MKCYVIIKFNTTVHKTNKSTLSEHNKHNFSLSLSYIFLQYVRACMASSIQYQSLLCCSALAHILNRSGSPAHPLSCRSRRNAAAPPAHTTSISPSAGTCRRVHSPVTACGILQSPLHVPLSSYYWNTLIHTYPSRCVPWPANCSYPCTVCRPWRRSPTSECRTTTRHTATCTCQSSAPPGPSI